MLTGTFKIPSGMSHEEVADTFAAYRLGPRAFISLKATVLPHDPRPHGPYRNPGDDMSWQLDDSNLFWLFFKGADVAQLGCPIEGYLEEYELMVRLFELQYPEQG